MPLLKAFNSLLWFSVLARSALACTARPSSQRLTNSGFEDGETGWGLGNSPVVTVPEYPVHSGSSAILMSASYAKSADAVAINTDSYIQQLTGAASRVTFALKAYYSVIAFFKGSTCPDNTLPLGSCKIEFTYAFQNIITVPLTSTTGYLDISLPVLTETGGRYIQIWVSCKPPVATPACAEVQVLLDDITFTDPGWDCSWIPWGCYTDSQNFRSLPHHGILHNWPLTTTVEACADACHNQGFTYAGLEYGVECWCGNGLGSSPATDGCDMSCSGNPLQICGGPDRLSVYHKIGLP